MQKVSFYIFAVDSFSLSAHNLEDNENKNISYYLHDTTKELAEFLYTNAECKVLFDKIKKVKKDDIPFVKEMIERMSNNN